MVSKADQSPEDAIDGRQWTTGEVDDLLTLYRDHELRESPELLNDPAFQRHSYTFDEYCKRYQELMRSSQDKMKIDDMLSPGELEEAITSTLTELSDKLEELMREPTQIFRRSGDLDQQIVERYALLFRQFEEAILVDHGIGRNSIQFYAMIQAALSVVGAYHYFLTRRCTRRGRRTYATALVRVTSVAYSNPPLFHYSTAGARAAINDLVSLVPGVECMAQLGISQGHKGHMFGDFELVDRDGKRRQFSWSDGVPHNIDGGFLDHSIEERSFVIIGDDRKRVVLLFCEKQVLVDQIEFECGWEDLDFCLIAIVTHGNITKCQAMIGLRVKEYCAEQKIELVTLVLADYDNVHKVSEMICGLMYVKPYIVQLSDPFTLNPGRNIRMFAQRSVHTQKYEQGEFLNSTCPDDGDLHARRGVIAEVSTMATLCDDVVMNISSHCLIC